MRPDLNRFRSGILRIVDRHPTARSTVLRLACGAARRRGADATIIASAVRSNAPIDRALQTIQWAVAVEGGARMPRSYEPGQHLADDEARRRAAAVLAGRGVAPGTAGLRHLIGVDDEQTLDDLGALVRRDLESHLARAATRPHPKAGQVGHLAEFAAAIQDRLAARGIRPFLMSGSLLGAIREGRFMAHDYDIDVGLLPTDDGALAEAALSDSSDLTVRREGKRLVVTGGRGLRADVFEHVERDGRYWHSTLIHEWWNTPFQLTRREVEGRWFWIPDDAVRYLDENYGDWQHPVAFYDISFDTPNRRYVQDKAALRHLYMHCLSGLRSGDRWAVEAACRELRDTFAIDVTAHLAPSPLWSVRRSESLGDSETSTG